MDSPNPIWHPYTPSPHLGPKANFVKAKDQYVYDDKGNQYFDATSSWWCNLHGHCHPRLVEALSEQANELDQILLSPHTHPIASKLAARLLEVTDPTFSKVFYSDNGSTAVEVALKLLLQYWHLRGENRKTFVSLSGAYHGDTLGAIAVSDTPQFHRYFQFVNLAAKIAAGPYCYRCPMGKTRATCQIECIDSFHQILREHHREIAGIIVEPLVLGAGGMIVYPEEYLKKLVLLAKEYHIPVIFDEVFTGFGRTGTLFAFHKMPIPPSIVCLSKGLTSGMLPMGATLIASEIVSAFDGGSEKTFYHGHTFTGNALSASVALESLKIFEEEGVLKRNERLSALMQEQGGRFLELPHVGDVRHTGMIWAMELVEDKYSKKMFSPPNRLGWEIAKLLWAEGIWVRPMNQVLYVIPPYCSTQEDLKKTFDALYFSLVKLKDFR